MNRAEARRAARGVHRMRIDNAIRIDNAPIPDDHPLAFVRDYARDFGLTSAWLTIGLAASRGAGGASSGTGPGSVPAKVGLSQATYLAITRYGYDPLTAVVYRPDVHGVCTLRELAQVTAVDLPVEARRERLYWAVQYADNVLTVGRVATAMYTIADEGEAVIAAAPLETVFAVFAWEHAEALFEASGVKPQRLWPVAHEGQLGFVGKEGQAGYTAATLGQTLDCLIEHLYPNPRR